MKCPKCGSEVKPNYKFCTKCGQPMTSEQPATSVSKSVPEKSPSVSGNAAAGAPTVSGNATTSAPAIVNKIDNLSVVKGKAVWTIGPGQLARRVTESEFAQLDNLLGVVIQEGVTSIISVDGLTVGLLKGGNYSFATESIIEKAKVAADKEEIDEKESAGILEKVGQSARRVWRFLTGTSDQEKVEDRKRRTERVKRHIMSITSNSTVNVTLISNRVFELLFGSSIDSQGNMEFVPLTIKSKVVDLQMGVSLQMQVTNIHEFLINYLADKNSICVADMQKLLQPTVEKLLSRVLRNLDYQADGLPEQLIRMISDQVSSTINERVHGMEVVRVLDITDQSADFERFRMVEHELFASEQELGFLQRTGEFRNRLAVETNAQEIRQAQTAEDLRYALAKINRDGLLHDDEQEAFVELLDSQKRLREAKTDEQEYEALQELRKCRLTKDDDVDVLEEMLLNKKMEREEATDLLRLRIFQSTEEARLKAESALSDIVLKQRIAQEKQVQAHAQESETSAAQHRVEMTDLDIQARRKLDEYEREQSKRNLDMERDQAQFEQQMRRAELNDDMDILERKAAIARQNMEKMQEHELKLEEMKHQTETLRIQTEANMTQEQIAAAHIQDMAALGVEAQAEMAKMMGSGKEKEAEMLRQQQERERVLYEQMLKMQQQNLTGQQQSSNMTQQQMMEMMQMMMNGMTQMGLNNAAAQQQRYDDMTKLKDEYREDAIRQQGRVDHTQDSALDYTSRVTTSAQDNNPNITIHKESTVVEETVFCPACGGRAKASDMICPHCGEPLE